MPQVFNIRISDKGPGIADIQTILDGQYRSKSGMGLGILGARRLMDHFKIDSNLGKGTTVEIGHRLPGRAAPVTRAKLADVSATLQKDSSSDPLEVLRQQNRELLQSLEEIRRKGRRASSSTRS